MSKDVFTIASVIALLESSSHRRASRPVTKGGRRDVGLVMVVALWLSKPKYP